MSRSTLAATLAVAAAAAFGCSTQITVVDPPPTQPPGPTAVPVFNGATNQASSAPLPISGGTLLVVTKGDGSAIALAADPDEDAIYVVSLGTTPALVGTLALQPGDEPGRMVADASGRVHVVLRGGGGIASILPNANGASLLSRRAVCSAPRGIDYNPATDAVIVACATGEVATLPAAGGAMTASVDVARDLRDVVVDGSNIYVTRFRSAEILTLDQNLTMTTSGQAIGSTLSGSPSTAWRAVKNPNGGMAVVHQIASLQPINIATPPGVSSYGGDTSSQPVNGGAGGVVIAAVATVANGVPSPAQTLTSNPVVDLAVAPNGSFETVSIQGVLELHGGASPAISQIQVLDASVDQPDAFVAIADAQKATTPYVVVQRRGPHPSLLVMSVQSGMIDTANPMVVALPQKTSHVDTGFDIFHQPASAQASIACMSCHPEGGDDGHTWQFALTNDTRARRTQSLRGSVIRDSAPYHWDGDMTNLQVLCDEVFTHRMGGGALLETQTKLLSRFVNAMPRVPVKATLDQDRVAKGLAIFNGEAGCSGCHVNGTGTLTQNQDIGKFDIVAQGNVPLQVPMLFGVADRAPYMHDGCAATLMDRLNVNDCTGTKHGNTAFVSAMSADDKTNLVEYLQSL